MSRFPQARPERGTAETASILLVDDFLATAKFYVSIAHQTMLNIIIQTPCHFISLIFSFPVLTD